VLRVLAQVVVEVWVLGPLVRQMLVVQVLRQEILGVLLVVVHHQILRHNHTILAAAVVVALLMVVQLVLKFGKVAQVDLELHRQ
jgi:hypothetical protein